MEAATAKAMTDFRGHFTTGVCVFGEKTRLLFIVLTISSPESSNCIFGRKLIGNSFRITDLHGSVIDLRAV
ncbi:hypothetical protein [Endozoicomonas sp.]|uniref:hypothetical protein n=1 Tax=Endozoicomonas sp. TaxID=1892382 RepID=UPI00383B0193